MLFDNFERIRIINLPHRTDRRREMSRELAKVGLANDPRVQFSSARGADDRGLFYSRGAHGCFLSHRAVVAEAASAGDSMLLLEDDCDFAFPEITTYQIPSDCDVFYGGYLAKDPNDPHNSDIIGAHFMGFSARAAKAAADYLAGYLEPDFKHDPRAIAEFGYNPSERPGIDGAYVWFRRAHPELVTVFASLSYQRPSRTDVGEQKWFDRAPLVRDLASMARKMRASKHASGSGAVFK